MNMNVSDVFFSIQPDKKHPLRCAVYDRYMRRDPLKKKRTVYREIAEEFGISSETVARYIKRMETGRFTQPERKQGRYIYAWDDEALRFFTNFYLAAKSQVGDCTVRNAYNVTREKAQAEGWKIGSEQSAYIHARRISPAMLMLARGGRRALDNMFYISRDLSKLQPFELIVGDQHRFDFWCSVPGRNPDTVEYIRVECYLWLDMGTRIVYGVSFDKHYSSHTVLRALRVGINRFGKFGSTYNDNGTSEKSDIADEVVARLQSYGVRFLDEADLYQSDNGRYVVEDADGAVVDVARNRAEWHAKHRRIFARVKNAKTKPIERFFSTLEQILLDMCLPGYVKEVGMSAPEEEEAQKRLDWQKKHGYILPYDDFIKSVLRAIDIYENRKHTTLGVSPREYLRQKTVAGWRPTYISKSDESYLFMERAFAVVKGDRVTLFGREYIGPELTKEMVLENRGTLTAYSRKKIELRYDPDNIDLGVFAIEPDTNNAIALRLVEKIDMFDGKKVAEQIAWKKRQMAAVVAAFNEKALDKDIRVLTDKRYDEYKKAETLAEASAAQIEYKSPDNVIPPVVIKPKNTEAAMSDEEWSKNVASIIASEPLAKARTASVFMTERDRYEDILTRFTSGDRLTKDDVDFKYRYEQIMTEQDKNYFGALLRINANN